MKGPATMAYVYRGTVRDLETPFPEDAPAAFDPSKCGTYAGVKQHRKHGTERCRPCKNAENAYHREYRAKRRGGPVPVREFRDDRCGTLAGYSRHARHNVPICDPCRAARRAYREEYNHRQNVA